MRRALRPLAIMCAAFFITSCGGGSSSNSSFAPSGSTSLNLTIKDTPPAGVAILSFEISVTGAVLHNGSTTVPLLSKPVKVEITRLETESALLSTLGVAPGTYNSITVTFANPEMTIKNDSANTVLGCAPGAVCDDLKPPLSPSSVDYSGTPFPLNLKSDTGTGLLLDFNLQSSVQTDLSIQPTISFSQLPVVQKTRESEVEQMDDLRGQISALGSNQFTLQSPASGQSFTVQVNDQTQYEGFGESGLTNAFSSLQVGQIVEVNYTVNGDGSLLATKVELKAPDQGEEIAGTITSIDPGLTKFDMVVLDEVPDISGVQVGNIVTVTMESGTTFLIDSEDLQVPSDLSFATAADLMIGQTLEVSRDSGSSGTAIATNRLRLHSSQLSATIESISGSNILVNDLPGLLTSAGITQIQVRTLSQTEFDEVSGLGGLAAGERIALRGLLFGTSTTPVMLARKVRKL